jgi:hypothetical protein
MALWSRIKSKNTSAQEPWLTSIIFDFLVEQLGEMTSSHTERQFVLYTDVNSKVKLGIVREWIEVLPLAYGQIGIWALAETVTAQGFQEPEKLYKRLEAIYDQDLDQQDGFVVKRKLLVPMNIEYDQMQVDDLNYTEHKDFEEMSQLEIPTGYVRVTGDYSVKTTKLHGQTMLNLIWYKPKIDFSSKKQQQFLSLVEALEKEKMKYSTSTSNRIVDVVDPDFNIRPRIPDDWTELAKQRKAAKSQFDMNRTGWAMMVRDSTDFRMGAFFTQRGSFEWTPSLFEIEPRNGKCVIHSRIHDFPAKKKNQPLYSMLAKLFEIVFPMFKELGIDTGMNNGLNEEKDAPSSNPRLQVVTRVRKICIPQQASFETDWSVEGVVEGVVAVAIVRIDQDKEDLKLQFGHRVNCDLLTSVDLASGSAVVFSNTLRVRVCDLANYSKQPQCRNLVMFYLIDPDNPIHCTADEVDAKLVHRIINSQLDQEQQMPLQIVSIIMSYSISWEQRGRLEVLSELEQNQEIQQLREEMLKNSKDQRHKELYGLFSNVIEKT